MEYKFSGFKRPKLEDIIRDFFSQMDLTDISLEIEIYSDTFFDYVLKTTINYFELDNIDKFLERNKNLKVMSIIVNSNNYTIKCC